MHRGRIGAALRQGDIRTRIIGSSPIAAHLVKGFPAISNQAKAKRNTNRTQGEERYTFP